MVRGTELQEGACQALLLLIQPLPEKASGLLGVRMLQFHGDGYDCQCTALACLILATC